MKQRKIGEMIYLNKFWMTLARKLFGSRWFIIHKSWSTYQSVYARHIRGINERGQKFVYCPVSLLTSWNEGDYDNAWCHACHIYFQFKPGFRNKRIEIK